MKRLKVVVVTVLAMATLLVVLQNTDPIETQLLVTSVTMPLALLLGVAMLVGFLLGLVMSGRFARRPGKGKTKATLPAKS